MADMDKRTPRLGLVLSGGGARAAYQAGVLRALSEMSPLPMPFQVLAGASAGAINAAFLAAHAADFREGARRLWDLWATLAPERVFRGDAVSLGGIALRWMTGLGLGGLAGGGTASHLLDTAPLRRLAHESIDFEAVRRAIESGALHGLAVSATNYKSGTAVTFFDGDPAIEPWARTSRIGLRAPIGIDHVLASAAIPIFFPPVQVCGAFYGDGCIRLTAPLSPAIHLGADRIVAIGVRHPRPEQTTLELCAQEHPASPRLAEIAGVLLNAVFLDALDFDLERVNRINHTISLVPAERGGEIPSHLRQIPCAPVRPSVDLGNLASDVFDRFPWTIRYLMRGLGASGRRGFDMLSYFAFDAAYTVPLLELGYRDAMGRRAELEAFLAGDPRALAA